MRLYAIFCMLLIVICLFFAGCRGQTDDSPKPVYYQVYMTYSNGLVMDLWKVRSREDFRTVHWGGYPYTFTDSAGNEVRITNNMKIIHPPNEHSFDNYHEYHMEHERVPYRYLYNRDKGPC